LVQSQTENERKTKEVELLAKSRDQKDKHLTVLLKEKEKLHKQVD
jgi:hypothetical protein